MATNSGYRAGAAGESNRGRLALLFIAGFFLLVLPAPNTIALRVTTLVLALVFTIANVRRHPISLLPLKSVFLAWLSVALASLFYSLDPVYSLGEIKAEIFYGFAAYFIFYAQTRTEKDLYAWLTVLLAGLLAIASTSIFIHLTGGNLASRAYIYNGVGAYTTYLITIFPFVVLVLSKISPRRFPANLLWLLPLLLLYSAYVTYNRMFWISVVVASFTLSLLLAAKSGNVRRRVTLLVLPIVVLAVAVFLFDGAMQHRLSDQTIDMTALLDKTVTIDPRPALWRFSLAEIAHHPWTGTGFGQNTFALAYPQWQQQNPLLTHAHNIFLNAGLQMGLPGLFVLAFLFLAVLREFWRFYRNSDPRLWWIGACGITLVVGVVFKNMTDSFFARDLALLFWSLTGMLLGYGRRIEVSTSPAEGNQGLIKT